MSVVGVDGCKTGWVAVVLSAERPLAAHHLLRIDDLPAAVPDAAVIAIDIPIGLSESGPRAADVEVRKELSKRRNSVFLAPVPAAVEAPTHAEAVAASMRLTGAGVSQQSYRLAAKIREVERWRRSAPCPVFEVHPEVSFAYLLGAEAAAPKKTWAGMVERRDGLAAAGIHLDAVDGAAARAAAVDDMLDAAVAAWTASRIAAGTARRFPHRPSDGPAIWA